MNRIALALVALSLAACQNVYLADSVDWSLDFDFTIDDQLHTPYVVGSQFRVSAHNQLGEVAGWSLTSLDPTVLSVQQDSATDTSLLAAATALNAGIARIRVNDETGAEVYTAEVEVQAPDRVEVMFRGWMLVDTPEADVTGEMPRVAQGGTGTFLVRYFAGETELFGNGVLRAIADPNAISVEERTTYLFKDREWLSVTPQTVGPIEVELWVGDDLVDTLVVVGTDPDALEVIGLYGEDESFAGEGNTLDVLAVGYDEGGPVYGIEYIWDVDGTPYWEAGDLFRYSYDPEAPLVLSATHGDVSASAQIHADAGWVRSTNDLGCNATQPTWLASAALPMLLAGGLVRVRRRKQRC